ncbi:MAG TPA: SpoIIE family protein phosphatase [Roseimicrobium sp.]|nr:SpoIIE family protein phosphatase [Roseimicrobium sp.]
MNRTNDNPEEVIEWAVARRARPGEQVSGDEYLVKRVPHGVFVAVVDGLGHGQEATTAAKAAIDSLERNAHRTIISLVDNCHDALRETRGAVVTMASINALDHTVTWMGIGNVEGVLIRQTSTSSRHQESVLLRGGVVGYHLPTLRASIIKIRSGDVLILATDGIRSGFADELSAREHVAQLADRILQHHFKGTDDALVLVVRYQGLRHE